jgi:hypothetical protein
MSRLLTLAGALLLSACVTINIYFPESQAEKAADALIDDIWQLEKEPGNADAGTEEVKK